MIECNGEKTYFALVLKMLEKIVLLLSYLVAEQNFYLYH